jgi:hypothetical protein
LKEDTGKRAVRESSHGRETGQRREEREGEFP